MCVNLLVFSKPLIRGNYHYGKYKITENPFLTLRNLKAIWVKFTYGTHVTTGKPARAK